jgi:energy-coupling factor transport system ATP-binding protein
MSIEINSFAFSYTGAKSAAIRDCTLDINDGEFVGVAGHSGSGKTTLLFAMCGVIPHFVKGDFYGSVVVGGKDTVETKPVDLVKEVNLVMQDTDSQFATTVVEDEIRFGLDNFGVADKESLIDETLDVMGIAHLRHYAIKKLSGGQKRKVAIASIIALKPKILLLDEPTGELDPESKEQVFMMLKKLNEQGLTIVVTEKNEQLLRTYCGRIIEVENGDVKSDI